MPRLNVNTSTEVVKLSYWVFAFWWWVILGVHLVTCVYNALYAFCYWELQNTYLDAYLKPFHIGMPPPYHHTIAAVYICTSAVHAVCILLMLGGSLWHRSLAFTLWSSCNTDVKATQAKSSRARSVVVQSVSVMYTKIADRHGLCGVNGKHFHAVLICREIIETALQTVQAYRMSMLLPRTLLNRFYVVLIAVNCWSSVMVFSASFGRDEARRRFTCIILDCMLDLMACMGVELIVLLSYVREYNPSITGFDQYLWYNDEWVARALNEFRILVVVSWADLISRTIFSLGLVMTTTSMKELLQRLPRKRRRVVQTPLSGEDLGAVCLNAQPSPSLSKCVKYTDRHRESNQHTHGERLLLRTVNMVFAVWGALVLGFHIHASAQPTLPQCLMQVRPWARSRPSCYLVGLDCYTLGITGKQDEVHEKWSEFDSSTVVQLLIRHCPALEMPNIFTKFHGLRGIKLYNTTIDDWGESAAITNTNHSGMSYLFIVRVNMTGGLLPVGFQSSDFPPSLYDIEMCVTNLREIPDDLDTEWSSHALIQVEYSQLTNVPQVLMRLKPKYLAVTGNPITELPPEMFEVEGMTYMGIGEMNIHALPQNVTQLSSTLSYIYMGKTNISFFWSWVDELVKRMEDEAPPWEAGASAYCNDLEKIENGTATAFQVQQSANYSALLMNPSEEGRQVILNVVDCDTSVDMLFYPLGIEDSINAISATSPLTRQY